MTNAMVVLCRLYRSGLISREDFEAMWGLEQELMAYLSSGGRLEG